MEGHADGRGVAVWTPPGEAAVVGEDGVWDAGDVVPGFRIRVAEMFRLKPGASIAVPEPLPGAGA